MWGKPKTELCLSLTQRYSKQLYHSEDGLHVYVHNSPLFFVFWVSLSHCFLAFRISPLLSCCPSDRWPCVLQYGPNVTWSVHPELYHGCRVCTAGFVAMAMQELMYLGDYTMAPPGGRQSSMHFEQPQTKEQQDCLSLQPFVWFWHWKCCRCMWQLDLFLSSACFAAHFGFFVNNYSMWKCLNERKL